MTSLYIELNKVKQLFIVHVSKSITKLSTIYNVLWNETIFFSKWVDLGKSRANIDNVHFLKFIFIGFFVCTIEAGLNVRYLDWKCKFYRPRH